MLTTISPVSSNSGISAARPICNLDSPTARITVSSDFAARPPRPSRLPMTAMVGNSSYMRRGVVSSMYSTAWLSV